MLAKEPGKWEADDVRLLFNSHCLHFARGNDDDYAELTELLNSGEIEVVVGSYRPAAPPQQGSPEHAHYKRAFAGPGDERHGELKWWAWNWLIDEGEPDPLLEQPTECGIADLVAPRLKLVVECGDTAPHRVIDILITLQWDAFVLFPFDYEDYSIYRFRLSETARQMLQEERTAEAGRYKPFRA